jgi:hypothetical protein
MGRVVQEWTVPSPCSAACACVYASAYMCASVGLRCAVRCSCCASTLMLVEFPVLRDNRDVGNLIQSVSNTFGSTRTCIYLSLLLGAIAPLGAISRTGVSDGVVQLAPLTQTSQSPFTWLEAVDHKQQPNSELPLRQGATRFFTCLDAVNVKLSNSVQLR